MDSVLENKTTTSIILSGKRNGVFMILKVKFTTNLFLYSVPEQVQKRQPAQDQESPYDFALNEYGYRSVKSHHRNNSHGILDPHPLCKLSTRTA